MNQKRVEEILDKITTWVAYVLGGAFAFAIFLGLVAMFRALYSKFLAKEMLYVMNWPVAFCISGVASLLAVYYMYQQKILKKIRAIKAEGAKKKKSKITKITIISLCSAIVSFALLMTSTNALVNIGIFLCLLGISSFVICLVVKFFVFLSRKIRKEGKSR